MTRRDVHFILSGPDRFIQGRLDLRSARSLLCLLLVGKLELGRVRADGKIGTHRLGAGREREIFGAFRWQYRPGTGSQHAR
jgi:hypothetical protein